MISKTIMNRRSQWLETHGDRTEGDVEEDDEGDFVLMRDGLNKKHVRTYLPATLWRKNNEISGDNSSENGDNLGIASAEPVGN